MPAGTANNVDKYAACIEDAEGDRAKARKCAELLSGTSRVDRAVAERGPRIGVPRDARVDGHEQGCRRDAGLDITAGQACTALASEDSTPRRPPRRPDRLPVRAVGMLRPR